MDGTEGRSYQVAHKTKHIPNTYIKNNCCLKSLSKMYAPIPDLLTMTRIPQPPQRRKESAKSNTSII